MTRRKSEREIERTVDALAAEPGRREPTVCTVLSAETIEPTDDRDVYRVDGVRMELPGGPVAWLAHDGEGRR